MLNSRVGTVGDSEKGPPPSSAHNPARATVKLVRKINNKLVAALSRDSQVQHAPWVLPDPSVLHGPISAHAHMTVMGPAAAPSHKQGKPS